MIANDIVKKYNLENPCYTEKEMDVSLCDELYDSSYYYYFGKTKIVDSIKNWHDVWKKGLVFRKSIFKYDTLKSGFSKKLTITTEHAPGNTKIDTFIVCTDIYNKHGLLIEKKTISTSMGKDINKYIYNLKKQRVKFISYVNKQIWTDENYYYNKKGLQNKTVYKKGVSDTSYNDYTPFDSLLAIVKLYEEKKRPYILNFYDKNRKVYKNIMYSWSSDGLPYNCTYFYYNSNGLLTKDITLSQDVSNQNKAYNNKHSFVPVRWCVYKYDKLGRLKSKVTRIEPYLED